MKSRQVATFATAVALLLTAQTAVHAASYSFFKVVDTSVAIPGGIGNFTSFGEPTIENGKVAFLGRGSGQEGIYTNLSGSLVSVADFNTLVPTGGGGSFARFGNPSMDGGAIAFAGDEGAVFGPKGIYSTASGSLALVVNENTLVPGGGGSTFDDISDRVSLDGGTATFVGDAGSFDLLQGIYQGASPGTLGGVAVRGVTPVPNGSGDLFDRFGGGLSTDAGAIAFTGGNAADSTFGGVYSNASGSMVEIARQGDPIPGKVDNFTAFLEATVGDGRVVFNGQDSLNIRGGYSNVTGSLTVIADSNTPIPGGSGNFTAVDNLSLNGGRVVFFGRGSSNQKGVFTDLPGTLDKVLARNDAFDGKVVSSAVPSREALSELGEIAMRVSFTDGSAGIYIATLGAGLSSLNPVLPTTILPGQFLFTGVDSGLWFDPPAGGYEYEMTAGSLFTDILDFPFGFDNPISVETEGSPLGAFGPGDSIDFVTLLGHGVSSFTVSGLSPPANSQDPLGFPLQLAFDTATADFTMTATIVPEPSTLALAAFGFLALAAWGWRRRR